MANVIKIKRSASTSTPTSLAAGELAYSEASDTLFIGSNGGADIDVIAGLGATALITGQSELAANTDPDADYLLVYDDSAGTFKKTLTKYVGSLSALGITATASEINTVADGSTSLTSTTVASGDGLVLNDSGTMKQIDVDDLDTYLSGTTATLTNKTLTSPTINTPTITGNTTFSDGAYNFNIASHDGTNGLALAGTVVSSTAAELNKLDGATVTTAEINILDGDTTATSTTVASGDRLVLNDSGTMVQIDVDDLDTYFSGTTATLTNKTISGNTTFADGAYDFNIASHDGTNGLKLAGTLVTSSAAELNILDGVTSTASELNILDGVTATTAELNYLDLTAAIGTGTASEAVVLDANGDFNFGSGDISATDITATGSLTGTLATASQTSITAVGTLNGLTIAGSQTVSMGSNKITNVADPTQAQDAATKAYVDAVKTGLDFKDSARVATVGSNITIATALNNGDSLDNVTLADGDRVLVKDQTDASENGIYVVGATPARATDFDADAEVSGGAFVYIEEGDTNSDAAFVVSSDGTLTVGTSNIEWTQFSGAGQITAGTGLTKTGNTINAVGTTDRITANANSLDIASTYVGQTSITTLGTIGTGTWNGSTVGVAYGGTGLTSFTKGSVVVANSADTLTSLDGGGSSDGLLTYTSSSDTISWANAIDGGTF